MHRGVGSRGRSLASVGLGVGFASFFQALDFFVGYDEAALGCFVFAFLTQVLGAFGA